MRRIWIVALLSALAAGRGHTQELVVQTYEEKSSGDTADKVVSPPKLIHRVVPETPSDPESPVDLRCAISIDIDAHGVPQGTRVIRCSDPKYALSCQKAAMQDRYQPAMDQAGKPVPLTGVQDYTVHQPGARPLKTRVRFAFASPPGTTSPNPDADGHYPYTKAVVSPTLKEFADMGFGDAAYSFVGSSPCDVLLTINPEGKAVDPIVSHCSRPAMEKPAIESLINSRYKPGTFNGKAVPIRLQIHLEFENYSY
jgi:hypothetical protein